MPIKGFPERKRMRRVGIVRLGVKLLNEKTGKEYPRPTDYFVLDDAPGLTEIYGGEPRTLNILMVSDDPEIAFPYYMMRYRARGLVCMGDGDRILRRRDEDGKWIVVNGTNIETGEIEPCLGLDCRYALRDGDARPDCQPTGRLRFICADNPTHGYYQLTVRKRAIEGFLGQLAFAKDILGRITGYPWQLILEQETVQLQSGQRKLWIPQLEIEPAVFQELLKRRHVGDLAGLPEGIREPTPEMETELTEDLDYEESNGEMPDGELDDEPPEKTDGRSLGDLGLEPLGLYGDSQTMPTPEQEKEAMQDYWRTIHEDFPAAREAQAKGQELLEESGGSFVEALRRLNERTGRLL